jgi:hypothetical protein
MKDRYLLKGQGEMRIVKSTLAGDTYREMQLKHPSGKVEICHVSDDDVAFEFYEISDEEYVELGIEPRQEEM